MQPKGAKGPSQRDNILSSNDNLQRLRKIYFIKIGEKDDVIPRYFERTNNKKNIGFKQSQQFEASKNIMAVSAFHLISKFAIKVNVFWFL